MELTQPQNCCSHRSSTHVLDVRTNGSEPVNLLSFTLSETRLPAGRFILNMLDGSGPVKPPPFAFWLSRCSSLRSMSKKKSSSIVPSSPSVARSESPRTARRSSVHPTAWFRPREHGSQRTVVRELQFLESVAVLERRGKRAVQVVPLQIQHRQWAAWGEAVGNRTCERTAKSARQLARRRERRC
eukprot:SAG31_NODE_1551_length_7907_cov_29.930072_4_plen_185_part_00